MLEDNSSDIDSVLGFFNDETFNILVQEKNDFWSPPDPILFWYEKIIIIHLKGD